MKQEAEQITQGALIEALAAANVEATEQEAQQLLRHASLVLLANETMNLTRITSPSDMLQRHIVDSLAFLPFVDPLAGDVIDIGAGAGYPGIPLAIMGAQVALCESVKKKAGFLESAVADLGLHVRVFAERAEEHARTKPAGYDVVVARALSALPSLVELAAPLLKKNGRLIALKGTPSAEEEGDGARAAQLCGMHAASVARYTLLNGDARSVYVYQRTGRPSMTLPRRPGMAQRHPLV